MEKNKPYRQQRTRSAARFAGAATLFQHSTGEFHLKQAVASNVSHATL